MGTFIDNDGSILVVGADSTSAPPPTPAQVEAAALATLSAARKAWGDARTAYDNACFAADLAHPARATMRTEAPDRPHTEEPVVVTRRTSKHAWARRAGERDAREYIRFTLSKNG